jgi:TetR/AcrR family transcriptional regulator, transcriptional repressor of aconitase
MALIKKITPANDEARRTLILGAALECFLKFGYSKTSLDDIAKQARLSRPLLYLKYKNKEEIFKGVFDFVIGDGYEAAKRAVDNPGDKKKKLLAVYDTLLLKPWEKVMGQPMSKEFYDTCTYLFPEISLNHKKMILKYTTAILEDKKLAEVLALASEGLQNDLPDGEALRERLEILLQRFF